MDIKLKDGTLVDAKSWPNWDSESPNDKQERIDKLRQAIRTYLAGTSSRLRLEFRYPVPGEVDTLLQDLRTNDPGLGNRVTAIQERA